MKLDQVGEVIISSLVFAAIGLVERQLWGKARRPLEQAAADSSLSNALRRKAWATLAQLAQEEGDAAGTARCFEAAARLG